MNQENYANICFLGIDDAFLILTKRIAQIPKALARIGLNDFLDYFSVLKYDVSDFFELFLVKEYIYIYWSEYFFKLYF